MSSLLLPEVLGVNKSERAAIGGFRISGFRRLKTLEVALEVVLDSLWMILFWMGTDEND